MVKISIIMPVYNAENFIKETLNSIVNQTFQDFELICIDDGSSDDSLKILNEYADWHIKVIPQENKGVGATRNRGLKESSGDYVFFMDSDDQIHPMFLEKVYKNLTDNDSDIVLYKIGNIENDEKLHINPYKIFSVPTRSIDFSNYTFNYESVRKYVMNLYFAPWMKVYRKEFLEKYDDFTFDETLPYEDVLFHIKSILRAPRISFIPEYLYYYRTDNPSSLSKDESSDAEIFKVIETVHEFLKKERYLEEFKDEYEYFKVKQITTHINQSLDEDYFKKAKSTLDGIDVCNNPKISKNMKKRFKVFFDSPTVEIYQENLKLEVLRQINERLKRINDGLRDENRELKNEKRKQKTIKKELLTSNSWKMTEKFRKISNFSFKGYLLNRSGSFQHMKSQNKELQSANKKLNSKLKEYERECPICGYKGVDFTPYPLITHKEVECPNCKSHERHRALWLYFKDNPQLLKKGNKLLHFAPEVTFNKLFKSCDLEYHPVDISSKNPYIIEQFDVQDIPYEDNYFDVIYCSHILEHVPDDRKAIRELYRVLKPGGTALILVPINGVAFDMPFDVSKTVEDESYDTPELRDKYYGQFDHVRLYGTDFKDRLIECGFKVQSDDYIRKLGYEKIERYALIKDENIFECRK